MKRLALALLIALALNATPAAEIRSDDHVTQAQVVQARDTGGEKKEGKGGTAVVRGDGGGY